MQISFILSSSLSLTKVLKYCKIISVNYKKGFKDLKQANILYFVLEPLFNKSIVTL